MIGRALKRLHNPVDWTILAVGAYARAHLAILKAYFLLFAVIPTLALKGNRP